MGQKKQIYIDGQYLVIQLVADDGVTPVAPPVNEPSKNISIGKVSSGYYFRDITNGQSPTTNTYFADILKQNGENYEDEPTWISFFRANTGKSSAGGGANPFTSDETDGIQNANDPSAENPFATINDLSGSSSVTATPYTPDEFIVVDGDTSFSIPANTLVQFVVVNSVVIDKTDWTQTGTSVSIPSAGDGNTVQFVGITYSQVVVDPEKYIDLLISQTDSNDPDLIVVENTLGYIPTAIRNSEGVYTIGGIQNSENKMMVTSIPKMTFLAGTVISYVSITPSDVDGEIIIATGVDSALHRHPIRITIKN